MDEYNNFNVDNTHKKSYIAVWVGLILAFFTLIAVSYIFFYDKQDTSTNPLDFDEHMILQNQTSDTTSISMYNQHIAQDASFVFQSYDNIKSKQEHNTSDDEHDFTQLSHTNHIKHIKPKVVIIIDDLANPKDIRRFDNLGLKLNLSLFPKQFFSKRNPEIAKTLDFYMIHLPLEAQNFIQQDVETLHVGDKKDKIDFHIAQIKRDFPSLRYLNNHTGSRYTASKQDMKILLDILDKYGITFVDSKTTSNSVVKELFAKTHKIYLGRDIFLDNDNNAAYITQQLNKALKIADTKGYVIAIGHPHNQTYRVLQSYKKTLLKNYDMLYIHELEKILQQHHISDSNTPLPYKVLIKDK